MAYDCDTGEGFIVDEEKELREYKRRIAELLEKRRSGELLGAVKTSCHIV